MIFWSKNETTFKKLGEKKCIELINSVVSCRIPDPISESFAYDSVMKFQKHSNKCSKSCLVKTMDGENFECRYGFPKISREYTKLNLKNGELFADKSMGWREYELRRNENEELIGDYNLPLLLVWQGNINVQVLISGNISNLIKYLTKPMSAKVLAESCKINNRITKNLSVSAVAAIGSQFLKNKPYGSIECVDHLLNYPLSGSSFNVRFINTNPPEKRQKTLATNIQPENLTPENVYQATMLDNYLPNRDEYLQSFSYYNIAANFNIVRRISLETKSDEDDQNAENMDDENFIDDIDDLESTYSSLPSQSSQFSQLSEHSSQSVSSTSNPSQSSQLSQFSELSALSQSISSSYASSNPSQEDIKNQQKYGGNAFLNANYSVFNEKSPTFCHPKIKVGTLIKSGYKDVYFLKRAKPVIPRFYLPYFDESNFLKANDYFRRLCVMFIPFNKEDDLKSDEDGYITKFMDFYDNLLINNKDAADDILRITKNFGERLQLQFETAKKLENETIAEKEALGIEEINESEDTSKQLAWLKVSEIDETLLEDMIQSLNEIQSEIFDEIITTISEQENSNATQATKQIIKFISGVAGTGKSHLIKALAQYLILHYTNSTDDDEYSAPAVIIGAPTAYAASALAIGANTIHSIFGLVEILSKYKPMTSEIASEKKVLFDNCKLIIIDEISMCSNVILMEINLRCQEISGNKKLFGGMNIMAFGDLLQLPPIKSLQVFEPLTATQVYSKFVGGVGLNLWEEFEYHELKENMRQKNALIYSKALERLRIGESTEADIRMFKSRIIPAAKEGEIPTFTEMAKYYLNLCEKGGTVMAIFSKVDDVNMFNNAVMKCKNLNIIDIYAKSSKKKSDQNFHQPWKQSCFDKNKISKFINLPKSDQSVIEQYPNQKTKLPNLIRIAIGCRIILKRNLDMSKGLINGALGTLRDIKSHEIPSTKNDGFEMVVDKLLIEFDHALGKIFEISRDTVTFKNFKGIQNSQSQFPIAVAFSCTTHKGQGASLDTVMVSLKDIFEGGQAYVALSRVKTLEGLHISVWDQSSFKVNTKAILEYNRLRATIGLPAFNVPRQDEIVPLENDELIFQGNGKMPILKLFNSNDRQNCVNSTIQILRKIPELLQWIQNHIFQDNILFREMKEILEYIGKDEIANTEKFGATVSILNKEIMYDPEKLIEMISAECDDEIKSLWQFKKTILAKCRICNLEYEIPANSFNILKLVLPQSLPKLPFEELLNFNETFQQIRPCLMCTQTAPQQIRTTLTWPIQCQSKYLFISLDPFNRQQSKAALKITNHLTKRQKIGGKLWDLIGAIEHKGASKFSGSYIPWLCDERSEERKTFWHKICDDKSFEICNFSDLSKDVILLYKKHCKYK
uniref:ATP-dependent DNA helicase n=1 Tax=Panagrolaimus sp. PS1159 TaxID=55785 RepID=A0AC35F3L7_9BILA